MKKGFWLVAILPVFAGCNSDIVTTQHLRAVKPKCVYIEPIESEDPFVGKVLRDVLEKEFVRRNVRLCDENAATIILTGSTFLTVRSSGKKDWFGAKDSSAQAIESVSLRAKDKAGNILLTASYDNRGQFTASKLAQEFGSALADKFK